MLREMSPNQRKRLTKADLESEFKKLGIKKADDGRPVADLLKTELLDELEALLF